jgi:hypothetical protein
MEMGVRPGAAKRRVGRLKGSRGAINRTISVVDLFHRTDRSVRLVGLRYTCKVPGARFDSVGPRG